jgi:hypothetical protein
MIKLKLRAVDLLLTNLIVFYFLLQSNFFLQQSFNTPPLLADDSLYYLNRIEAARRNWGLPLNPYFDYEYRGLSHVTFPIESISGFTARLFGVGTTQIYLLMIIVFFNVNFFLLKKLLSHIYDNQILLTLLSFITLISLVPYSIFRPISPQVNISLFMLIMLLQLGTWNTSVISRKHILLLCLMSFQFFVYPYFATVSYLTWIILLTWRSFREKNFAILPFLPLLVVPIPWLLVYATIPKRLVDETSIRTGLVSSNHFPGSFKLTIICLLALGILSVCRNTFKLGKNTVIIPINLISILLISNSQILTGISLQFESHLIFPMWINAVSVFLLMLSRKKSGVTFASSIALSLILFYSIFNLGDYIAKSSSDSMPSKFKPVIGYILSKDLNGETISAPNQMSEFITYLTENKVLSSTNARLYLVSDAEIEERNLANYFPKGLGMPLPDELNAAILGIQYSEALAKNSTAARLHSTFRRKSELIRQEEFRRQNEIVAKYQNLDVSSLFKKYNVTFVIRETRQLEPIRAINDSCDQTTVNLGIWSLCEWR